MLMYKLNFNAAINHFNTLGNVYRRKKKRFCENKQKVNTDPHFCSVCVVYLLLIPCSFYNVILNVIENAPKKNVFVRKRP